MSYHVKLYALFFIFALSAVVNLVGGAEKGGKTDDRDKNRSSRPQQKGDEFPYKLENAPIPSVHDGPRLVKLRSDRLILLKDRAGRWKRSNTLNPQKPEMQREKEEIAAKEGKDVGEDASKQNFHHPGHSSESTSVRPANAVYGGAFPHNQSFEGYRETANIGIVPPKDYYKNKSDLKNYPNLGKHSLYEGYPAYRYGVDRETVRNAYNQIFTGLAIWSILNGLTDGKRYAIYDKKTIPKSVPQQIISNGAQLVNCSDAALTLCAQEESESVCLKNQLSLCVRSTPCAEDNCNDCAVKITLPIDGLKKQRLDLKYEEGKRDATLCVTSVVAPIGDEKKIS